MRPPVFGSVAGMTHPYVRTDRPVGFAHRGGAGPYPENTEAAFRHAVDLGFEYLETDVHVTADGVLVAFHDDRLDRVTDARGEIAVLPWTEVAAARVGGSEPILRLQELLERFPTERINIDPKAWAAVEPLASVITRMGVVDRVCVTAFSRRRTRAVKRLVGPGLCTGGAAAAVLAIRTGGIGAALGGVDVLQVPVRVPGIEIVTERFVATAHRRGIHVHVWTIDDPHEMDRLLDLGVDGIMTDEPEVLRTVFGARGLW